MKKLLLLTVFICIVLAMSAATSRVYMQRLNLMDGSMPGNPAISNTPIANYNLAVTVTGDATVYQTTGAGNPANICLRRTGASPNFYVVAYVNQSIFAVNWPIGSTLSFTCTYIPTGEIMTWTKVVPAGTSSILDTATPLIAPPYPSDPWYFDVTSTPAGAAIWVDGVNSTFVTPHAFSMVNGTSALFSVSMTGYTFAPVSYQVTNITTDASVNFNGTIIPPPIVTLIAPVNDMHFPATAAHTADVLLEWSYSGSPAPTSFRLSLDGAAPVDLGLVTSHSALLAEGPHTWQMFAFYADGGAKSVKLGTPITDRTTAANNTRNLGAGSEIRNIVIDSYVPPTPTYTVNITSGNITGATIWLNGMATADVTPHVYTLDAGTLDLHYAVQKENYDWVTNPLYDAAYIPTLDGNKNIDFVGTFHVVNVPADMEFLGEPNIPITGVVGNTTIYSPPIAPGLGAIVMTFSGTTTSDLFVVVPAGTWGAVAYYSGAWHTGTLFPTVGPGTITFFNVPFGAKAPVPLYVSSELDDTLDGYPYEIDSVPSGAFITVQQVVRGSLRTYTGITPITVNIRPTSPEELYGETYDASYSLSLDNYIFPSGSISGNAGGGNIVITATNFIPPNEPTVIDGTTIISTIQLAYDATVDINAPVIVVLPNIANLTNPIVQSYSGSGTGDLTVSVSAGIWFGYIHYGGAWHRANTPVFQPMIGPGTFTFLNVPFGAKGAVTILLGEGEDPTLPVELSSFTAVLTAEYFVNLTWVTESETQVLGFHVYRSETNDIANAVRVNATAIGATNTSEQHTYTMTDREVETNATYYYWLENVDMGGGNAMHGPQMVTVTGNPTPVLPEISMLNSAYPNPFRSGANTNINVSIKAGETGTVTVYNILGQSVKTFKVSEGTHTLRWDGKNCGSGIYFYKLATPTTNATKKLVIVK